jgi:RNA polymerase sigma factor (sigma-70 family)
VRDVYSSSLNDIFTQRRIILWKTLGIKLPQIRYQVLTTLDPGRQVEQFEKLMLPILDAAYSLAFWLTRNQHDAEDAVQEAYLRALKYFDSYDGRDPRAWLLVIVRNTCISTFQKDFHHGHEEFDEQVHSPRASLPEAEANLMRESRIAQFQNVLEQLSLEHREVLALRELEELSYKEIATMLDIPVGTVMSRLTRGRRQLVEFFNAKDKSIDPKNMP